MNTDRIEKSVLLRAPLNRVWRAISDPAEFGSWFGMQVDGPFEAGRKLRATIVPTTVDPEIAKAQEPHQGIPFELAIERMEPERLFSFRWTHALKGHGDVSTLVTFTLQEQADGVLFTVTESGFDAIPLEHRAKLFSDNEQGWAIQTRLVAEYLRRNPQTVS